MTRLARHASFFAALLTLTLGAAKAASAEPAWVDVVENGGPSTLLFGEPDSDIIWFGVACRPGYGRVELLEFNASPASGQLTLVSGERRANVAFKEEPGSNEGLDLAVRKGELPIRAPLLSAFRATGRLGAASRGAAEALSAETSEERAAISRFFEACAV